MKRLFFFLFLFLLIPAAVFGVKISDFIVQDEISDNALIPFVENDTNYTIKFGDLQTELGSPGDFETYGPVTGVPIYFMVGSMVVGAPPEITNYWRNLVSGNGIDVSVGPEGGALIAHAFDADTTGVPVLVDAETATPKIRSLTGGSGINVSGVNGNIQIALSATPASTKTVIVNELADFPTPAAGVITLDAETGYYLTNDITTSNRFVMQDNTVLEGADGTLITLEYTGSGNMITAVDSDCKLIDLILDCSSGTLLDISDDGTHLFQMISSRCICDEIGTVDGVYVANFENIAWEITTDGIEFLNNNSIINFLSNIGGCNAGSFIDLGTSTFDGFSFNNSFGVLGAGATFITGAADSANVNSGGLATVLNTRALGSGTALSGITTKDALWQFFDNANMPDSRNTMLATHAGATITIAAANTPVIIGATWTEQEVSRFTTTAGGRFTYTGNGAFVNMTATITADIATGVDDCTFYFFKNGVEITASGVLREIDAGNPGNLSMIWGDDLDNGDYIEIWCENNDASVNIIIENIIFRMD